MNAARHLAVEEYLRRLRRSMSDLPAGRHYETVAEIEEHIAERLAELGPAATDADVRYMLDRVGDPGDLTAEARGRFGIASPRRSWTDVAALILLLTGLPPGHRVDRRRRAPVDIERMDHARQAHRHPRCARRALR